MTEPKIILAEILNPEVYTGITERDFHLHSNKKPFYVHIETDSVPKCSCQMYDSKYGLKFEERCDHILFVLKEILHLNTDKVNLTYSTEELGVAFDQSEKKYKDIKRETYGIAKRKNFPFPTPKKYMYEYDKENDGDGYESHEWRIKERLYSRGIVAEEFHASDNDYSETEKTYDNFFQSDKEAKPTSKVFEKSILFGKQLELDKKYKEGDKFKISFN